MTASRNLINPRTASLSERIARYSVPHKSGCVLWKGCHNEKGYAYLGWKGGLKRAHRLVWINAHGPIAKGLCVLHRCDNPGCVNLKHLWLGTQQENIADRDRKKRGVTPDNRGENNGQSVLTAAQVRDIRASKAHQNDLAKRYGITPGAIYGIRTRRTWKHL